VGQGTDQFFLTLKHHPRQCTQHDQTRVSTGLPWFKAMLKVREGMVVSQGTDQLGFFNTETPSNGSAHNMIEQGLAQVYHGSRQC
jgi:hypothetical protein